MYGLDIFCFELIAKAYEKEGLSRLLVSGFVV
jgi:hypothetical protein